MSEILRGRELTCGYDSATPVVRADVRVSSGEIVAIMGGSGSGKSTLLKTLSGLLAPIEGTVEMFGEALSEVDEARHRELIHHTAMVFQHDALLGSMSLLDNVALPVRERTDLPDRLVVELARSKLTLVGVGELAHRLPSVVSGGQRKRAAIARAMVLDPALLFCDEPTSGLDPITAARVDETLVRLRDAFGIAVLAVTHDVASVRSIADRALVLGQGEVRMSGPIDVLVTSDDEVVSGFFHRADPNHHRHRSELWQPQDKR